MHIKQVTIQGFKSYKNETVCDPFSPGHNVIVGRNGSGKSNFFFAIRFVLSDMYTSLSNQERAKLLHGEGIGMSVMSAYVEMVFDNSDNRIPIEREDVTLRRSIGLKKDEYFLDSKHVTKQEVMNLLESSGFSRSNSCYIVQQGKIVQLATMKDGERLNLLKEVAGTKVYDDRRLQSLQILEGTSTKKERIEEVLAYIEERLAELEDEKDELKEYQELDRSKRAIEYTIYDKELRNARDALEKLDAERQTEVIRREKYHESLEDEEQIPKGMGEELAKLQNEISRMKRKRSNIEGDRKEALKEHAKLELDGEEIKGAVGKEKETGNRIKRELKKIQQQIKDRRAEVVRLTPEVAAAAEDAAGLQAQLETAKARQQEIFSKETRTSQFGSEEERDAWIDEEVKSVRSVQTKKAKQSEADIARITRDLQTANEYMEERVQQVADRKKHIETINAFRESKVRKDDLTIERKKLWTEDAKLDGTMADLKADRTKAERALYQTTSKARVAVSAAEPEPRQPRQLCQPRLRHKMPRRVGTTLILAAVCCWSTTAVIGADMAAPEQSTDDAPADDAGVILLGAAVVLALSAILLVAVINRDRMGTESAELTASDLQDTGRRTSYHTILAMSHAKRYAVDGGMESESEVEEISELTESELAVYRSGRRSTSYHAALAPCAVKILSRFVAQGLAHDKEKSMQATDGKPGTYFYSKGKKSSEPSETGSPWLPCPCQTTNGPDWSTPSMGGNRFHRDSEATESGPWSYRAVCESTSPWLPWPWPWRTTKEPDWVSHDPIPVGLIAFLGGKDRFEKPPTNPLSSAPGQPEVLKRDDSYTLTRFHEHLRHCGYQSLPSDAGAWFAELDRQRKGHVDNTDFFSWMRENEHLARKPLGCFGTVGRLLDTQLGRCLAVAVTVFFFYYDVWTDVQVVRDLMDKDSQRYDATASPNAAYTLIGVLLLLPIVQSLVDSLDPNSVDWRKGVLLNLTYTRMVYFVWTGWSEGGAKRISKAAADAKLFEAIVESMPQLLVQSAVVAAGLVAFDSTIVTSLAVSVANIAYSATLKVHTMYGMDQRWDGGVFPAVLAFVYFGVDSATRAIAVYMTIARHGMRFAPFAPYVGAWVGLEVVYRGLSRNNRAAPWGVDPSLVSGALALLSALPLSTNPTERRWLFATSTVAVLAAAWGAGFDVGGRPDVTVAFAVCVSAKGLLFVGLDLVSPAWSDGQYGYESFSFDVDTAKQQVSWSAKDWARYFDERALRATAAAVFPGPSSARPSSSCQKACGSSLGLVVASTGPGSAAWRFLSKKTQPARDSDRDKLRELNLSGIVGGCLSGATRAQLAGMALWINELGTMDGFKLNGFGTCCGLKEVGVNSRGKKGCFTAIRMRGAERDFPEPSDIRWLGKLTGLTELVLSFSNLGARGGSAIGEALKSSTSLRNVNLEGSKLGEEGGVAVAEALKIITGLQDLNLGNNRLGEVGGTAVAKALETNTSLQNLDLAWNRLGEQAGVALGEALKVNTSLQNLGLSYNKLGETGGAAVAEALKTNTSLKDLNLQSNRLGEQTGVALGKALETNTSLQNLNLSGNGLGASKTAIKAAWGDRSGELKL